MSPVGLLAVIMPAGVAMLLLVGFGGASRFRRHGLLMALSGGTAVLGAGLLTCNGRAISGPMVMILDSEAVFSASKDGLEALVRQYEAAGMDGCDVVLIQGARGANGSCATPAGLDTRPWLTSQDCARLRPSDALTAPDPDCALQVARQRLGHGGWLGSASAALRLSSRRIAVLVSQPRKWAQTWIVNPTARAAELAPLGISVDLVRRGDEAPQEETPTLSIEVSPPRFPERQVEGAILLQLSSRALAGLVGSSLTGKTQCQLDAQGTSGFRISLPDDHYAVQTSGTAARRVPIRVGDFRSLDPGESPYTLVRGFHLLKCTVSLSLPDGRQLPAATGEKYLDVGPRYFMVVAGQAGGFPADDVTLTQQADIHALWGTSTGARSWTGDIAFGEVTPEASFLVSGLPKGASPTVLVLHDLRPETWAARCADLEALVASGTTLVVSGAPLRERAPGCDFLPAFARPAGAAAAHVDRRPRVTFLLDPSRLGALHHRPQRDTVASVAHVPIPARQYNTPAPLASGLDVQNTIVHRTCEALRALDSNAECGRFAPPGGARQRYVEGRTLPVAPFAQEVVLAGTEAELGAVSQLALRLKPLVAEVPAPGVVRSNEVVVLFTYDLAQLDSAVAALDQLLRRGVLIEVVQLQTPYAAAVTGPAGSRSLGNAFAGARSAAETRLRLSEPAAALFERQPLAERLASGRWTVDLTAQDANAAAAHTGDMLGAELNRRLAPNASLVVVHRRGRFVDERLGPVLPEGTPPRWKSRPADAWAAPLRFEILEANDRVDSARLLSAVSTPDITGGTHGTAPIAFGGVYGRGEIVVLGYSIFEGMAGVFFPGAPWRRQAASRIVLPPTESTADAWGPRRVIDAVKYQASIEPGPGEAPRIVGASVVDPSGRIEVEVVQRLRTGGGVDRLELIGCRSQGFSGGCSRPPGAKPATGRIVGLDSGSQRLTYSFLPSELKGVCGEASGCIATLQRRSGGGGLDEVRLFVDGLPNAGPGAVADLRVLEALRALSLYSGGAEIRESSEPGTPRQPVRSLVVQCLLAASLMYWAIRLAQRWRTARTIRLVSKRQVGSLLTVDARGAVHSAGEALGRPQSTIRVGAFAGFRALEAGDRLASAVREDIVLYTQAQAQDQPARIPRVARHIDELGRHVRVLVSVGMSMRIPGFRQGQAAKLLAAAKLCELVAEVGWQFRSSIEIIPVGLVHPGEAFGPSGSPGSRGEVTAHVLAQGRRPARWKDESALPVQDRPMSVVMISDFLNEDLERLRRFASNVEEEGGLFGALHVHAPDELLLLGAGVAPAFDMLCDRTTWSAMDARMAQRSFRDEVEAALGGFSGGLLSVSSALTPSEVLGLLADSPLLGVLR